MIRKALFVQYTNPAMYPPLEHSSNILAENGWQIEFLGSGSLGESQQLELPTHPNIRVHQLPYQHSGWGQKGHFLYFFFWVFIRTLSWQPTWIYASDLFACPVALLISYLPGKKIIYHEHDSPSDFSSQSSSYIKILMSMRRRLARRADICILPNQSRANIFQKEISPRNVPLIVWNCPRQSEVIFRESVRENPNNLAVWYHGTIVPSRVPRTLVVALASLPATVSLTITGYETIGYQEYKSELYELATKLGLGDRLSILPAIPSRNDLLNTCARYDVGVSFMPYKSNDINMRYMTGASNKPFDYLACGLGLLISDLPDWKQLYVEKGLGLACDPENPESIALALNWFLEHPDELQMMGRLGQEHIARKWNYEIQFTPVLEAMMQQNKS